MIEKIFRGECFTLVHCEGAIKSLTESLKSISPAKKQKSMIISLKLQIERLTSGKRSAELSVRKEGLLPSFKSRPPKNFWAIKKIPIRGYYWESERKEMTYFISHYIYKDFDQLHDSDTKKVCNNWNRIEELLDES